jgi:hypothetical protein
MSEDLIVREHCGNHGARPLHWWPEKAGAGEEPGWWVVVRYKCKDGCRERHHVSEVPSRVRDFAGHAVQQRVP